MSIQETLPEDVKKTLISGHKQLSGDLIQLLDFNLQRILDVVRNEYEEYKGDYTRSLDDSEKEFLENFFDIQIDVSDINKKYLEQMKKEIVKVEQALTLARLDKIRIPIPFITLEDILADFKLMPDKKVVCFRNASNWKDENFNLVSLFKGLPDSVETLDLAKNDLKTRSTRKLQKILKNIPKSVTNLSLSDNGLVSKGSKDTLKLFQSIPENIESLDFSNNKFGRIDDTTWVNMMAALPRGLKRLNLSGNELRRRRLVFREEAFKELPTELEHIDFGELFVNRDNTTTDVENTMNLLPQTIKSISFTGNPDKGLSLDAALIMFHFLPKGITSLGLTGFFEKSFNVVAAKMILDVVPDTVRYLDLSNNNFGSNSFSDLGLILTRLPKGLRYLNLGDNSLGVFSNEELQELFGALPSSVRVIGIQNNGGLSQTVDIDMEDEFIFVK